MRFMIIPAICSVALLAGCGGAGTCQLDSDCSDGFACIEGSCLQGVKPCQTDEDCDSGYNCIDNFCRDKSYQTNMIGCNADLDSRCEADEYPYHKVTLSPYKIDKTEVTQARYQSCVEAGECSPSGTDPDCRWDPATRGDHPVVCVNWDQARKFCDWDGKRLPTEAEWELAARGEYGRIYPWGNTKPSCDLATYGSCAEHSLPVGSIPDGASPAGALDMAGNVYEWVHDWYDPDYYANSPSLNPQGPASGEKRVMRGGGYYHDAVYVRTSNRGANPPEAQFIMLEGVTPVPLGFRCAMSL
jgi:formylglycine-generating enzyme required for sulfatase activity